ncbi:MAG TPA: Gfo/Idh/MocA family oxidoreductase [Opitutaceae bacterium]|nr:Gfo/Idh/MocA family oxidoreductase [Opitutaceae bacterium]
MLSPTRKIRWGVLGYARIAREALAPAIQRAANSHLHAVASRDPAKLVDARQRFGVSRTYSSYDELLRDPEVDAVYLPLPNALHCAWTIQAAEHGKHVLCEKPLALNAAEGRDMVAACASHGVTLMEAFMYRYTERTRQVQAVLRSGVLGEIKFIHSTFRFLLTNPASIKLQPELGGGALYDVGCYPVNFIGWVADEAARSPAGGGSAGAARPESVAVECVRTGGVDTIFSALLRYPTGLLAALHCGFNAHLRVCSDITGTRGVLEIPDTFLDNAGALTLITGNERREIPAAASDRYRLEVEDFADAVLQQRAPQFGLAETLRNLELIDRLLAAGR